MASSLLYHLPPESEYEGGSVYSPETTRLYIRFRSVPDPGPHRPYRLRMSAPSPPSAHVGGIRRASA